MFCDVGDGDGVLSPIAECPLEYDDECACNEYWLLGPVELESTNPTRDEFGPYEALGV